MKNLIIVIAGIVVIGGLAFAGYKMGSNSDSGNLVKNVTQKVTKKVKLSNNNGKEESFFGSMQDLMVRGKSTKCTFDMLDENSVNRGKSIIYTAGGKIYSEVDFEDENGKWKKAYTIINGDWSYVWTDITPQQGVKMNIADIKNIGDNDQKDSETAKEIRKKMNYKCRPWISDNSKFVPPSDIVFKDMSTMMQGFNNKDFDMDKVMDGAVEDDEKAKKMICDICEIAETSEIREQCRIDAGCE